MGGRRPTRRNLRKGGRRRMVAEYSANMEEKRRWLAGLDAVAEDRERENGREKGGVLEDVILKVESPYCERI